MPVPVGRVNVGAVFAACGLLLNLVWCTLVGHAPEFARALTGFGTPVNPRTFFLVGILLVGIAFAAAPRWLRERGAYVWPAAPLLASFGTICFIAAPDQAVLPPALVSAGGLMAFGMGYLWLTAHLILLLARTQTFACMTACVTASLVFEPVVVLFMERVASAPFQVFTVVAMPFASALLFRLARRFALADGGRALVGGIDSPAEPLPWFRGTCSREDRHTLFVLVAAAALLLATVRSLSFVGLWGGDHISSPEGSSMMASPVLWAGYAALLALFACLAVGKMGQSPLSVRFQPPLLVIILTLCVSLILGDDANMGPALLDALMRLNDSFSHLLFWMLVATLINASGVPSYRAIGAASALYAAGSIVWVLFLGDADAAANLIVVAVIYVLALVTVRFGVGAHGGPAPEAEEKAPVVPQATGESRARTVARAIEGRCAEVARDHGLSPREAEILNLLAQGRTRAYIQEELVLAENTVKTHVAHIYAKLGVKDRQEMIDLILDV